MSTCLVFKIFLSEVRWVFVSIQKCSLDRYVLTGLYNLYVNVWVFVYKAVNDGLEMPLFYFLKN